MIEILAHRGLWSDSIPENSMIAFKLAWEKGYGIETDVRDINGKLCIAHDPFQEPNLLLEDVLKKCNKNTTIALNIKSDGLASQISILLKKHKITKYFVFDMSIPDLVHYIKHKLNVFKRLSDIEPIILNIGEQGYWKDELLRPLGIEDVVELSNLKLPVAIVSPELHNNPHFSKDILEVLKKISNTNKIYICTDKPTYYD